MRRARANRPSGLTLLELLVSVSIIALLAAILLPAIMQSRAGTRRTVCISNLRQWTVAVQMYADVHKGRLPYRGQGIQPTSRLNSMDDWINAIPQFAESKPYWDLVTSDTRPKPGNSTSWMCPDAEPLPDPLPPKPFDPKTFFAYGMNMALSAPVNSRFDSIDKVGPLQTMAFMADGMGAYTSVIPSKNDYSPIARHVGKSVNIAFLDGRVESYLGDDAGCHIGDPKHPDIVWYPPNSILAGTAKLEPHIWYRNNNEDAKLPKRYC